MATQFLTEALRAAGGDVAKGSVGIEIVQCHLKKRHCDMVAGNQGRYDPGKGGSCKVAQQSEVRSSSRSRSHFAHGAALYAPPPTLLLVCSPIAWEGHPAKDVRGCRFRVLAHSLRATVSKCLAGEPDALTAHPVHTKVSVVTVPKPQALQVIIPLSSSHSDDEPFSRSILHAMTDEEATVGKQQPKYMLWEANVRSLPHARTCDWPRSSDAQRTRHIHARPCPVKGTPLGVCRHHLRSCSNSQPF